MLKRSGNESRGLERPAADDIRLPSGFYEGITQVLERARGQAYHAVNSAMVHAYWEIGQRIVEEQGGKERAAYGRALVKELSRRLTPGLRTWIHGNQPQVHEAALPRVPKRSHAV